MPPLAVDKRSFGVGGVAVCYCGSAVALSSDVHVRKVR